jgi:hypothetical protein
MSWGFTSHDQLVAAGYTWRGYGNCRKCGRRILWYKNPDKILVPVDERTFMLHFANCPEKTPQQAERAAVDAGKVIPFATRRQRQIRFDGGDDVRS